MNRSRYVIRPLDATDRDIVSALTENSRMSLKELAARIGMSSPSITERLHKLEDAGAIRDYTTVVDYKVFGFGVSAYVKMRARPGEVQRIAQMLSDTPEIIEADRITGEDCFLAKVVAGDVHKLQTIIDRFLPFSSTDTAIVQSSIVSRRLPKL